MGTRLSYIADVLRNSYWFVPAVMLTAAALLAWVMITLDEHFAPERTAVIGALIYSGGPEGAHEVLGVIASSMITVAGVVFSIAIVSLQLASSQFGPRMLANFVRDRGQQVTLGTFVSGFLYSLLVLRVVRTGDPETVPHLSVTMALLLAIAGLSVLIYFVHHVATTIQAPNLVDAIAQELREGIEKTFPDDHQGERPSAQGPDPALPEGFETLARRVEAQHVGYVQVVDLRRLVHVAQEHGLVIRLETRPGRFVVHDTTFALVYPALSATDGVLAEISSSLTTGARRTGQQDIEFPIKQIVEIAVRALSPGINDPFTASTCVKQLGAALCEVARREMPPSSMLDDDGDLRVIHGDPVTWDRIVGGAFDQVRQAAAVHTTVYGHILESLAQVSGCVRSPQRLEALLAEGRLVMEAAEAHVEAEADRSFVRRRYEALLSAAQSAHPR